MGPLVVTAAMAWADQLDAYVERQGHQQPLGDALLEAGADEGTRLVVLALPRDTPDDVVQVLAAWLLAMGQDPRPLLSVLD